MDIDYMEVVTEVESVLLLSVRELMYLSDVITTGLGCDHVITPRHVSRKPFIIAHSRCFYPESISSVRLHDNSFYQLNAAFQMPWSFDCFASRLHWGMGLLSESRQESGWSVVCRTCFISPKQRRSMIKIMTVLDGEKDLEYGSELLENQLSSIYEVTNRLHHPRNQNIWMNSLMRGVVHFLMNGFMLKLSNVKILQTINVT